MDALFLSRALFAFTISFHYIFPPLSIGLGTFLVVNEAVWLKTKNPLYHQMARFWTRVFALTFAIGVATGIVMEFEFGTNWATYSRYVGDVFGSALAAEGIFAFFLESGFLAILLFGWNRVGPKMHFFATCMVCLGAHFSGIWIVAANSWMQTPAGYHIVGEGTSARAEITDFWAMVLNPSTLDRLSHVFCGAWQAGATLVLSVSAFYLLRGRHVAFARASLRIGLIVGLTASLLQLVTGHRSAIVVSRHQPAKLAAMEGLFETTPRAPAYVLGWVDQEAEHTRGLAIPGLLSWLVHFDRDQPVTGMREVAPEQEDRPPMNVVFQTYHLMLLIGLGLIALNVLTLLYVRGDRLLRARWLLWCLMFSVLAAQIANQAGWWTAEVGRQPWIVYGLLRTSQALSKNVAAQSVMASIVLFAFIYALLFAMFIYLLDDKIRHGPDDADLKPSGKLALPERPSHEPVGS